MDINAELNLDLHFSDIEFLLSALPERQRIIVWPSIRKSIGRIRGKKVVSLIRKRNYRGGWRNRNSLSPFSPPRGSRGKRDAVTWRWISFSPRPISTDFHNGSTYECTHLSPTPARPSLDPACPRSPRCPLVQPSLQPSVCSFFFHSIRS